LNLIGLKRHGFSSETILHLKRAYRILFRSHLPLSKALERVSREIPSFPELERLVEFLRTSRRGVCR
jgi:UDP-N-acetylglucosamine acyltransferase